MTAPRGYLLDTNVVSEVRRSRADGGVTSFLKSVDPNRLYISVLTIGELRKDVDMRRRSSIEAASLLEAWVDVTERDFQDRILSVDLATAVYWGRLSAIRSLPVIDALLCATAISCALVVVTRNLKDFVQEGVDVINPWQNSSEERYSAASNVAPGTWARRDL